MPVNGTPAGGAAIRRLAPDRAVILAAVFTAIVALAAAAAGAAVPTAAVAPTVRFEWRTDAGRAAAAVCQAALQERGADLTAALLPADQPPAPIRCLLLPTAEFRDLLGGELPDWGIGVALAGGRQIALDVQRSPGGAGRSLREIFLHEVAHALMEQAARGGHLPAWFHEGAALSLSGEWRFLDTVALILGGAVPSLSRLEGPFPENASWAEQAYRTSLLAVQALQREHGPGVVARIAARVGEGEDFYAAFAAVTGEDVDDFGERFGGTVRFRHGWLVVLTRWPALFVLLGLLFLLGAAIKLVRRRRRLREMPDEEDAAPSSS